MQRPAKTYSAAIGEERVSLRALIQYLSDARGALENESDDSAHYLDMIITYLRDDYKPSEGLKFKSIHLGL